MQELSLTSKRLSFKAKLRMMRETWKFVKSYDTRKDFPNKDAIIAMLNGLKFSVIDIAFKA